MSTVTQPPMVCVIGVEEGGLLGMCSRVVRQVHFFVRKKLRTSCLVKVVWLKQWFSIAAVSGISGRWPYLRWMVLTILMFVR